MAVVVVPWGIAGMVPARDVMCGDILLLGGKFDPEFRVARIVLFDPGRLRIEVVSTKRHNCGLSLIHQASDPMFVLFRSDYWDWMRGIENPDWTKNWTNS